MKPQYECHVVATCDEKDFSERVAKIFEKVVIKATFQANGNQHVAYIITRKFKSKTEVQ